MRIEYSSILHLTDLNKRTGRDIDALAARVNELESSNVEAAVSLCYEAPEVICGDEYCSWVRGVPNDRHQAATDPSTDHVGAGCILAVCNADRNVVSVQIERVLNIVNGMLD